MNSYERFADPLMTARWSLVLWKFCPSSVFLNLIFSLLPLLHGILTPQIYCISVHAPYIHTYSFTIKSDFVSSRTISAPEGQHIYRECTVSWAWQTLERRAPSRYILQSTLSSVVTLCRLLLPHLAHTFRKTVLLFILITRLAICSGLNDASPSLTHDMSTRNLWNVT